MYACGGAKELQLERLKATVENVFLMCLITGRQCSTPVWNQMTYKLWKISGNCLTVKDDLRDNYPYGMLALSL